MTRRRTTRRTALAGLGALGVMTTSGACSLLPDLGEEETPTSEPSTAGGGGTGTEEPSEEPGPSFQDWMALEDLEVVEIDTAAADAEFGTMRGQVEREDRYGTWWSPAFADDSSVFTAAPRRVDPAAAEALGADTAWLESFSSAALATNIVTLLDSPLLFAADNSRYQEIAPELLENLGYADAVDPAAFHAIFRDMPISGSPDPGTGVPEAFGLEPATYDPETFRTSLLAHSTEVDRVSAHFEGSRFVSSTIGTVPVEVDGREAPLVRTSTFAVGFDDADTQLMIAMGVNITVARPIEDPMVLPVLEPAEVPETWREHRMDRLTLRLPEEFGDLEDIEVTSAFGPEMGMNYVQHHRLGAQSPYLVPDGGFGARGEVPGADLTVLIAHAAGDDASTLRLDVHSAEDSYCVRLRHDSEQQLPLFAAQMLAGLRLDS